jgi:putative restriction endonuclease
MSVLDHFRVELNNTKTNYFILDAAGTGKHGDVDFENYNWSTSRNNRLSEGDLFIYRRPKKYSERKEFYFFGAGKLGRITGTVSVSARIEKPILFREVITKSDLASFEWEFKRRGDTWRDFFQQYGVNKINRKDFINLLSISDSVQAGVAAENETEIETLQAMQREQYYVDDDFSETKTRSRQKVFADKIKLLYGFGCAICGMTQRELLVAAHIVPWSERKDCRLDPKNGICLCVLHDKAFDSGLITIDNFYRIRISHSVSDPLLRDMLARFHGCVIRLPQTHRPGTDYLSYHQQRIFRRM